MKSLLLYSNYLSGRMNRYLDLEFVSNGAITYSICDPFRLRVFAMLCSKARWPIRFMRGPQTQNGWTAGEKGRRFLASLDPAVAVRFLVRLEGL
jgi:hypothetical protein